MKYLVSVAVPRPLPQAFTYLLPEEWVDAVSVGSWVRVPFGRGTTHAYVVEEPKKFDEVALPEGLPVEKLKSVAEVGSLELILPPDVIELCRWAEKYYLAPIGELLHAAAPPAALGLKNKKEPRVWNSEGVEAEKIQLTEEQEAALQSIESKKDGCTLLEGVTGSGKTELYIELALRALSRNQGVLILVPEIALTPQLHERFERGLGCSVGLWHSAVSDGRKRDQWAALLRGELRVLVGARSAVFAPVSNLGLIVVDEEHDSTYKQEERVRYHARDLAVVRAQMNQCKIVLGSATPSLETLENARKGRFEQVRLEKRYGKAELPEIELVNLVEEESVEETQAPLAKKTVETIQETLLAGEQVMVFLNRRGFAAFLVCEACGRVEECPNCSVSMTYHKRISRLKCHQCGHDSEPPLLCEGCRSTSFKMVGAGTESLEEDLPRLIPEMKATRLDRDKITSTKRLEAVLQEFRDGKTNTLLGTQMLVKGHDFPRVTLVVVILADALFRWPDFRAGERALQVLTQVSGRAGRSERPGRVLIQTYDPEHLALRVLVGESDRESFLENERELRKTLRYPPFGRMAKLRFERRTREEARRDAAVVKSLLEASQNAKLEVLGPSEALIEKLKNVYRWDLILRSENVTDLQRALYQARNHCLANKWPVVIDVE